MNKRVWEIKLENHIHTISLEHGPWFGVRRIWIDGELVEEKRKFVDSGSLHSFNVDGHICEVGIITNGITFGYFLKIDGKFVDPRPGASPKGFLGKMIRESQEETNYWLDLAEGTGLRYVEIPEVSSGWRHRLIGKMNDHWVFVRPAWMPNTSQVMINVLVRFAPLPEFQGVRAQIRSHPVVEQLIGKWTNRKSFFELQDRCVWITLRYDPRKETVVQTAEKIARFVCVVAEHTQPLPDKVCEGESLGLGKIHGFPELVFVNGSPLFLCSHCLQREKERWEEERLAYEAAPSGLLHGFLGGLIATIPASLLWAAITVIFDQFGAVFAVGILVGMVKVMDWLRTKRSIWSILIAAGLTMTSVVLGTYLALFWYIWQEPMVSMSIRVLSDLWQYMFQDTRLLKAALLISGLGVIPYVWIISKRQRVGLENAFTPKIERVEMFGDGQ
jgi:hypothetical protein